MASLSLLSNKLSSIQMSSVLIFLKGLSSSKMSSINLIVSSSFFCLAAASFTASNCCFNLSNSSFMACVSVSMIGTSYLALEAQRMDELFFYAQYYCTNSLQGLGRER